MKKCVCIWIGVLLFLTAGAQRSVKDLVGKWEAVREVNEGGGLYVKDSASIYLVYDGEQKKVDRFSFDFSSSPARFTFTIKDSASQLTINSLLQFINNDLIQWQVFEGDVQPAHFTEGKGDILYLRRKK